MDSEKCAPRRRIVLGRHRDERGAALIEFALVLPVLMAFLLGTITIGIA